MKKSIYCVGQRVIYGFEREAGQVRRVMPSGEIHIVLDEYPFLTHAVKEIDLTPIEDYLDTTNYFYHHRRFAEFQDRANIAFRGYMFDTNELEGLGDDISEKFKIFLQNEINQQAEAYAAAVELRDLASLNLAQWWDWNKEGITLNHHFSFINPEGIEGYHNL